LSDEGILANCVPQTQGCAAARIGRKGTISDPEVRFPSHSWENVLTGQKKTIRESADKPELPGMPAGLLRMSGRLTVVLLFLPPGDEAPASSSDQFHINKSLNALRTR